MRENLMSGSTGGRWRRGNPAGYLRVPGRCAMESHHDDLVGTRPAGHLLPRQRSTLHRSVVSSEAFAKLDDYMWKLTYKWARRSHRNKSKRWVVDRYFDAFNKSRRDRWVFGDRDSGAYLLKHGWTKIVRHQMVKGTASPDDPTLTEYWVKRRRRHPPPLDGLSLRLLRTQRGRCPVCGELLLVAHHEPQTLPEWERWLAVIRKAVRKHAITAERKAGTTDEPVVFQLLHAHCRPRQSAKAGSEAQQSSRSP